MKNIRFFVSTALQRPSILPNVKGVPKCDFVPTEGVSKLSFQCGSRDAKFCVSTIWIGKLLILNILCTIVDIKTRQRHASTIPCRYFATPYRHNEMMILIRIPPYLLKICLFKKICFFVFLSKTPLSRYDSRGKNMSF